MKIANILAADKAIKDIKGVCFEPTANGLAPIRFNERFGHNSPFTAEERRKLSDAVKVLDAFMHEIHESNVKVAGTV